MIRLISDVHGAVGALRRVAAEPGPLLVLGDLINFIDYRTNEGIVTDVSGSAIVGEFVALRAEGRDDDSQRLWREHSRGREDELRTRYDDAVLAAYTEICGALEGADAYVTYGNVDRPDLLRSMLPSFARYVDAEVVEIEGVRIGFAGGGIERIGTPGEVSEEDMAAKLASLGDVDVLCTHVPADAAPLATDVIAGRQKGSRAVLDYLLTARPPFHYFGDIHQPQATSWRIGDTVSTNAGYFRATGRVIVHG